MNQFDLFFEEKVPTSLQNQIFAQADKELARLQFQSAHQATDDLNFLTRFELWIKSHLMISGLAASGLAVISFFLFNQRQAPSNEFANRELNLLFDSEFFADGNEFSNLEYLDLIEELELLEQWEDS